MYYKDLTGKTYGALTVLSYAGTVKPAGSAWLCRCACGAVVTKSANHLKAGLKSCSAACGVTDSNKQRTKHGHAANHTVTKEYATWVSMTQRCHNPTNHAYAYYGGRGITVWDGWRDFSAFFADVGEAPSKAHTLDRIDNAQGYVPGNVRWATRKEQSNNIRSNVHIEHNGIRKTLAEWAAALNIPLPIMYRRAKKEGATPAILRPRTSRVRNTRYEYGGESMTINEWAAKLGIRHSSVHRRIKKGQALA